MRVKHYPRVSSLKQANKGDSVEFQDSRLSEDSKINDDEVVAVHTDSGKSASITDDKMNIKYKDGFVSANIDIRKRKGMIEILESLDNRNWDALKITKWDRFSRNTILSQLMIILFNEKNKKIIAVDDSNDSLVRDLLGVLGQKEIEKLKERIRDVRKLRFQSGRMVGKAPFGYKAKKKYGKVIGMEIYLKQAEIVKDCFLMASNGASYKDVCAKHKLKPQSYYNILKNKVYIGIIEFEREEKVGVHEKIVSEELWRKVNK